MATLLVATRKGLFTLRDGRRSWTIDSVDFLGEPVSAILPLADGTLLAALNLGHFGTKLHRRGKGAWEEVSSPAFPEQTSAEKDAEAKKTNPAPWRVEQVWTLEETSDGTLWGGTIPGGLFRSADHGRTWALVRELWDMEARGEWMGGGYDHPGIHSVTPDPRSPKRLQIGVSTGGVWTTADSGATWSLTAKGMRAAYMPKERAFDPLVQDVHRLVRCPAAPDVLWVQHHNGIFRSVDGGGTWTEIEKAGPSTFGFAAAVHPHDPKTAWFVPAVKDERRVPVDGRLVVTRTRDGGGTFDVLGKGLPSAHAYDLVYRHGLAVDATGERLAFGSTTGSLFASDDAGDSWTLVNAHLPPVYSVRFA